MLEPFHPRIQYSKGFPYLWSYQIWKGNGDHKITQKIISLHAYKLPVSP